MERLNSGVSFFLGADANGLIDGRNKNLPVTNLAGLGGLDDGANGGFHAAVGQHHFNFDFGQEIDGVFAAPIDFGVAFLAAKPFDKTSDEKNNPLSPRLRRNGYRQSTTSSR